MSISCSAIAALLCLSVGSPDALASKKPLIMRFKTAEVPVGNSALNLSEDALYSVKSKLGQSHCTLAPISATDTLNDNVINELTLGSGPTSELCQAETTGAMPFRQNLRSTLGTFPFGRSLGKVVSKQKGKSTTEGIAELVPSSSANELLSFSAEESTIVHECTYEISKTLKGRWHDEGPHIQAFFDFLGEKLKLDSTDNEDACPKSVTIDVVFSLSSSTSGEGVELAVL
jgi:hypothetical protein